ncbi:hypothetical protein WN51_14692 [Melipona quadrifasciata]|uniref:Uncharacterized protein n=1 Tax=Melipona quadrifasciata TaxID=166423 RepID=A0A0N0BGG6_9HYME|nr:hypothetical protein WN51_14692 [Melipona quadrifasciata]
MAWQENRLGLEIAKRPIDRLGKGQKWNEESFDGECWTFHGNHRRLLRPSVSDF